jgi:hypothetical protein
MKKQTAVEWLFDQIPLEWTIKRSAFDALQKAKAMEKEQICNAYTDGVEFLYLEAEQYYKETYNTDTQ